MSSPAERYRERRARCEAEKRAAEELSRRLSWARGATFLPAAALGMVGFWREEALWMLLALVFLLAFFAFALWHDRVLRRERLAGERVRLQERGLARLERRFDELVPPTVPEACRLDPRARDLDLFGPASLAQLLGSMATAPGRETLARWLLEPAPPEEIPRRQQAARQLAAKIELREELELAGTVLAQAPAPDRFLTWAESEPWLPTRLWLLPASRLGVALTLGALAAALSGLCSLSWFFFFALANLGLMQLFSKPVFGIFDQVDESAASLTAYGRAFAAAESMVVGGEPTFASPLLTELRAAMRSAGEGHHNESASQALGRLGRILTLADARRSGSGHPFLVGLFQWDFQVLALLEAWQARHGRSVRGWLAALGSFEALAVLGQLHHDEPEWVWPEVASMDEPRIDARQLGHPLLPASRRVANDVELGPPGSFLLVTGSNMSGKSTLLRALGLNVTLAQAGGPVCAAGFSLPPVALGTSLLVEDSLASGVSFFMAELQRLKSVVELATTAKAEGRTLLFLLDEVLRGTNSAERRIAVRRVLLHLTHAGAIGALTTHDLALVEEEEIAAAARPVHFRETLHSATEGQGEEAGPTMSFDYQLRPGLATTVNALKLLEMVGLGEGR